MGEVCMPISHRRIPSAISVLVLVTGATAQSQSLPKFDDHAHQMQVLGIKALRRGPDPNKQSTFDEANANLYANTLPDLLTFKNGHKVQSARDWPKRRREIVEDFEREVYGRIPRHVPKVTWEVTGVIPGESGGIPTITKTLIGRVDNRSYPAVQVDIQASFTVPAGATRPVPTMIEFGGFGFGRLGNSIPWTQQAIANGWGYGSINPNSIQPDSARLDLGIIGLCNHGKPRKPDDWGALRAWAWGLSRLIDYFETNSDAHVDPKRVGIEGVSRYGKAAIVAEAFDQRVAVGLIGSSGEGGTKLHRHLFGEAIENLAGGEFYWMAGNIIKYGSANPAMNAADLPVDSHELIALCAPRPCFISHGGVEKGDAKWIDIHGSFMSAVLAGPVYRMFGKQDLGTRGNYLTDLMPQVNQLIGGELSWRQHDGGHEVTPNWPAFFEWVHRYIVSPPLPSGRIKVILNGDQPVPRADLNSQTAHKELLDKSKQGGIDVYFEGDSITRRWGCGDKQWQALLANWTHNFYGWNAADFGWGGDTTQNILWRLRNGELDGVNPKVIVLLAGTDNLGNGEKSKSVVEGIRAILAEFHLRAPKATVILTGVFPRNDRPSMWSEICSINQELARVADGKRVRFLDVNEGLATSEGLLFPGMMLDGLHPTVKGYQVWADGLKPILRELLGPPAKVDHSPAPSSDPSSRGK